MKKIIPSLLLLLCLSATAADKPNILFILTDDMGYSDVKFNQVENSPVTDILTPNIDALANEGTIFKSAYACHMFCGPSRTGIMTGRYPHEIGAQLNLASYSEDGVDVNETFVSEPLKAAGYYTSVIGKWHLGEEDQYHPLNRGFDHFYGFLGGGHDYNTSSWLSIANTETQFATAPEGSYTEYQVALKRNWDFLAAPTEGGYLTDMLTDEAITVVNKAKTDNKPFFLYLAYNAPHTPQQAKATDITALQAELGAEFAFSSDERKNYCAMMYGLDKQIARVIQQLKNNGQYDNTLIVFTSDNGGKISSGAINTENNATANNHPLRGIKGDIDEGGIRVPFFMLWPNGMADAPRIYNHVVNSLDLYPTFLAVAGATTPAGKHLDGVNIIPNVKANTDARPNTPIFNMRQDCRFNQNHTQARIGNLKAVTKGNGSWMLYDVAADPSENTISEDWNMLKLLADSAKAWALTLKKPEWFDNPTWGWENYWNTNNMPNWDKTFPAGIGELPSGIEAISLTWANGGTDDRKIPQGGKDSLTFTYSSGITSKAYLYAESNGDSDWNSNNTIWLRKEVNIVPGIGNKVTIPVEVPAGQVVDAAVRLYMANTPNGYYSSSLKPLQIRYMDIVAAGSEDPTPPASDLKITKFTWEDGTVLNPNDFPGRSNVTVKITYTGAVAGSKLYLRAASKDNWGLYWATIPVEFPVGSGEVTATVTMRDYSAATDAERGRLILCSSTTTGWPNQVDVNSDNNINNDGLYFDITENAASLENTKLSASIYPNPSEGTFYINLKEDATLTVYDLAGKVIKTQAGVAGENTLELKDNGTHILTILDSKGLSNTLLQVK